MTESQRKAKRRAYAIAIRRLTIDLHLNKGEQKLRHITIDLQKSKSEQDMKKQEHVNTKNYVKSKKLT